MGKDMSKALLLNADYTPMHFISDTRAFVLVHKGRAEILDTGGKLSVWEDCTIRTTSSIVNLPATIRLLNRVHRKWQPPRFRKSAIYTRDNWRCQYCGMDISKSSATIDHVHPKSRGGNTSWKNCVASCKFCNRKKANKTPSEANMPLLTVPTEPNPFQFWESARGKEWHDDWSIFLKKK
jgi:5-methylcytosine-specific restriction endonuclease McrA